MWPDNDKTRNYSTPSAHSIVKGIYKHRAIDNFFVVVIDVIYTDWMYFSENGKDKKVNVTLVHYRSEDEWLTDEISTFLKMYIIHEPVYEYKYAIKTKCSDEYGYVWEMSRWYYTEQEAPGAIDAEYKRLDFTKRERKCQ